MRVSAGYGKRFFGNTKYGQIEYSSTRNRLIIKYNEELTHVSQLAQDSLSPQLAAMISDQLRQLLGQLGDEELRALAKQMGDPRTLLLSLECELGMNMVLGDFEATERSLDEYDQVAAELRQPVFIFMGMNYRTSWLISRGQFERAEQRVSAITPALAAA